MFGLVPQSGTKKTKQIDLIFYLSLILLIISISSYFALDIFIKNSSETIKDLEKRIADKETNEVRAMEKKVFTYQEKIEDFLVLLNSKKSVLRIFTFFESNCYPRVWFSGFSLDMEQKTVSFSGKAESFIALDKQLFILKQKNDVKSFDLSTISIGEEGMAEFGLNIIFNENIFIPQR